MVLIYTVIWQWWGSLSYGGSETVSVTECYEKNSNFPVISVPLSMARGYEMMLTQRYQQVNFANFYFGRAKREGSTDSKEAAAHKRVLKCDVIKTLFLEFFKF